jgi:predicted ester cyclase
MTENEATIRRYWQELWTEGHTTIAAEIYAPTYRENQQTLTPVEFAEAAAAWRAHFENFTITVDEIFSCGDRVITRVSGGGTHIFEFVDGRVVQHWHETDHLELFTQLGAELGPGVDA